jgi:hypothetical protein
MTLKELRAKAPNKPVIMVVDNIRYKPVRRKIMEGDLVLDTRDCTYGFAETKVGKFWAVRHYEAVEGCPATYLRVLLPTQAQDQLN